MNFAITGVAGYIAPRHLKAIRDVGGNLIAALDPHDAVGVLDQYFPSVRYFTEFERFDRDLEKLRRQGGSSRIHYLTVCSPNYLHDAHIRAALRVEADAICEKPLVLNPWNLDALAELEKEYGKRVYTILQLRVHPAILAIREQYGKDRAKRHQINLTYITSRGNWYLTSWKGNIERSGGLATNIGVHFFDMLQWIFGKTTRSEVHFSSPTTMSGFLELENADVHWYLSIDSENLPSNCKEKNQRTFRSITIDGAEVEFSDGFADLHTNVYREILAGKGHGIEDARASIELVHQIRVAKANPSSKNLHPYFREKHGKP
ncbi:MAG: Gfo/Idh/MocA family protein [Bacteriovoracia bacterium]